MVSRIAEHEHIGPAHEALRAAAPQRLRSTGEVRHLTLSFAAGRCGTRGTACPRYDLLGLAEATGGDEVFRQLVLARIIEPVSKLDSLWVLEGVGVPSAPSRTMTRRLRAFAADSWRQQISAACAAHAGLATERAAITAILNWLG